MAEASKEIMEFTKTQEQRQAEAEAQRRQRALEAEHLAQAERQRAAEAERQRRPQAEQHRAAEAERQRTLEAEQQRLAQAEQQRLAQAEQQRAAEAERQRALEAEQQRLAQAERQRAAEAKVAATPARHQGPEQRMQICVKTLTGNVANIDVEALDTIADIKLKFQNQEGTPAEKQKLIFGGKQLEDSRALADYGIKQGAAVHVVVALSSGPPCGLRRNAVDADRLSRGLERGAILCIRPSTRSIPSHGAAVSIHQRELRRRLEQRHASPTICGWG